MSYQTLLQIKKEKERTRKRPFTSQLISSQSFEASKSFYQQPSPRMWNSTWEYEEKWTISQLNLTQLNHMKSWQVHIVRQFIVVYLIRGFRCGAGAAVPLNNGAVSSEGFAKRKEKTRKRGKGKKKKIVRTTSIS